MDLNERLEEFKEVSLNLKEAIREYELEKVDELLEERESIMKEIYITGVSKAQVTKSSRELGILDLEEELKILATEKRNEAKEHLNTGVKNKQAYNTYNRRNTYGGSFISGNV